MPALLPPREECNDGQPTPRTHSIGRRDYTDKYGLLTLILLYVLDMIMFDIEHPIYIFK